MEGHKGQAGAANLDAVGGPSVPRHQPDGRKVCRPA